VVEFAFSADSSTMRQHYMFGDSQAEASAAGFAGTSFVHSIEALK
jgi:hypothetical protein